MSRLRHKRARRQRYVLWLAIMSLVLAGIAWGSYELYSFRTRQNTRKLLARARTAAAAEDWAGAATAYRQYMQRELDDVDVLRAYADVLLKRLETTPEVVSDALRTLQRVVGLQQDNTDAMSKLTGLYLSVREYALAEQSASNWLALDPKAAGATLALASAQHGLDRSRDAADTLVAAITRNPDEPEFYPLLIQLLISDDLDQPKEAAKRLAEALSVGQDSAGVHMAAFVFFERKKEIDVAEKHLRQALDLAPDSLTTRLPAALFYVSRDRLDEAGAQLDQATRIAPQNPTVLRMRAQWATRTGRPADVIAAADDFLRLARDNHIGYLVRAAELYLGAGEPSRTDECLATIDALPRVAEQLETRLDALRGTRAFQEGDYYSAIRYLRSATNREPPSVRALQLSAAAYAQLGDLYGATQACERLIGINPANVDARLRLAELEWEKGRLTRAREVLASLPGASDGQRHEADLIRLACDLAEARRDSRPPTDRASSLQELDRLASIDPAGAFPTRWLVRCLALSGKPEKAAELFRARLGDAESPSPRLGTELGRLLISDGLGEQVLTLAEALIKRFPDAPEGYILKVKALAATAGLSQAMEYVNRNELPAVARAGVLEAAADEYRAANQTETAIGLYRESADLMSKNVSVRRKLVGLTSNLDEAIVRSHEIRAIEGDAGVQGKFLEARARLRLDPAGESLARAGELLEECLADRRRWTSARLLLAHANELSGDLRNAADAYRIALSQDRALRGTPVAARLVQVQYRLGRVTDADALLDSLFQEFPDQPAILRMRTEQQARRLDFESALRSAEKVLKLQPDDTAWAVKTADLHLREAHPIEAEAIARAHLERSPDSTTVLWILARALFVQQRDTEALAQVKDAAVAAGDAPHYVLLARVLARLDRNAETEQALAQAQTRAPDDAAIWAACADVWRSIGQRPRQVAGMRKSVNLSGNDPAYSLALARVLAEDGDAEARDEATRIVKRLLTSNPRYAEALLLRGYLTMLSPRPNPADAEADFLKAVSIDPRRPDAYRLLGRVQREAGRLGAARESIDRGLALARRDPALLLASGELYSTTGDYARAMRPLHVLLEVQPRMPDALVLLSSAYRATNQIDKGIEFIETHAPPAVRSAGEIVLLARLHESKQDLERAGRLFEQATAADPASSKTHQARLRFLARQKDIEGIHDLAVTRQRQFPKDVRSWAMAAEMLGSQNVDPELRPIGFGWLATITSEHPDHAADATHRAALCHLGQNELREAESRFLVAQRLAPADGDIVNNLAWFYSEYLKNPAKAVALIDRFLANGGTEDAHLLDTHCVAFLRLKRFGDAQQKAWECLKISGQTPTQTAATYHLGLALMESNQKDEALSNFRKAKRLDQRRGGLTPGEREELRRRLEPTPPDPDSDTGRPGG